MYGSRITVRKKVLNGSFSFSRIASHRPSANFSTLATTV